MPELRIVLKMLALMWLYQFLVSTSPRAATEPVSLAIVVSCLTLFVALLLFGLEILKWLEDGSCEDIERGSPRKGAA